VIVPRIRIGNGMGWYVGIGICVNAGMGEGKGAYPGMCMLGMEGMNMGVNSGMGEGKGAYPGMCMLGMEGMGMGVNAGKVGMNSGMGKSVFMLL